MPTITTNYEVDLATIYTIDAGTDYATIVNDRYANAGLARAGLPGLDAYWDFMALVNANFNDANFLALNYMGACFNDAHWQTDGYTSESAYPDNASQSRGNILLPAGGYKINFPLIYGFGRYTGRGSANYTAPNINVNSAGTGGVNGYYERSGNQSGRPRYQLEGGASDDYVAWTGTEWHIYMNGVSQYKSTDDVTYPHKVTTWTATGGSGPVPNVIFPGSTWGTCLFVDHNYWLSDCMEAKILAQSHSWGDETNAGYNEGAQWSHVRFEGCINEVDAWIADPGHYDPSYESSGLAMWSAGSASAVSHCFASNFNDFGFLFANKGTPATIYNCSAFANQRAAVGVIGSAVLHCFGIEADDNPAVFYARAGYEEDPCILNLHVVGVKGEDGVTAGRYKKGQCVLDAEGWVCAVFIGVRMTSANSYPDALFRIKTTANSSYLSVDGLQIFNYYRTLLHDVSNDKKWLLDIGEYAKKWFSDIHDFKWISGQGGRMQSTFRVPPQRAASAEGRLNPLAESGGVPVGTFNDTAGTPAYVP